MSNEEIGSIVVLLLILIATAHLFGYLFARLRQPKVIGEIVRAGEFAVIVVEQHARLALGLTTQAMVLDRGRVVHRAASEELLRDPATLDRLIAVA